MIDDRIISKEQYNKIIENYKDKYLFPVKLLRRLCIILMIYFGFQIAISIFQIFFKP